jgi:hypothetical protein
MNFEREANLETIRSTDSVVPYPLGKASEEDYKDESAARQAETKERVEAMVPYFRTWFKRTIGQDMAKAHRYGNEFKLKLAISWVLEKLCADDVIESLAKKISAEKNAPAPRWPNYKVVKIRDSKVQWQLIEGVDPDAFIEEKAEIDHWLIMKAMMTMIRRYNYGMKMGGAGYIVLLDSNHQVSQSITTGENVWSLPTELTFTYWKVENNDYENPWELVWIQHPDDPTQRIQVKKYVKTAAVLKPWEKKVVSADTRLGRVAQLKEGEQITFKFNTDHPSVAADEIDSFMEQLSRVSIESNVRYYMMQPDEFRLIVAHQGKLYR